MIWDLHQRGHHHRGPSFRLLSEMGMLEIVPCLQVLACSLPKDQKVLVDMKLGCGL